jgi:hypothetical protein
MQSTSLTHVYVVQKDHANMDSFPFRFGLHFKKDLILDVFNVTDRRRDDQVGDRFHVEASFRSPELSKGPVHRGHFVLLDGALPKVVTVWRTDDVTTETYLSELIRNLRRDGFVTASDLLKLHPEHVGGGLKTAAQLFARLVTDRTDADRTRLEEAEQRSRSDAQRMLDELADAKRAAADAQARVQEEASARRRAEKERSEAEQIAYSHIQEAIELQTAVEQRDAQIAQQDAQIALLQQELMNEHRAARDEGMTVIVTTQPDALLEVNDDVIYRGSMCTELVMANGARLYMKTSTFDRLGRVTAKAKSLKGQRIKTTCWNPYDEPGYWSRQGYFRNLYPLID